MSEWTFITRHGAVLALIGQHSRITAREIASRLGITERYVRRKEQRDVAVSELLKVIGQGEG
jgi:DNA-binding CsgD family transcriptional regulator